MDLSSSLNMSDMLKSSRLQTSSSNTTMSSSGQQTASSSSTNLSSLQNMGMSSKDSLNPLLAQTMATDPQTFLKQQQKMIQCLPPTQRKIYENMLAEMEQAMKLTAKYSRLTENPQYEVDPFKMPDIPAAVDASITTNNVKAISLNRLQQQRFFYQQQQKAPLSTPVKKYIVEDRQRRSVDRLPVSSNF